MTTLNQASEFFRMSEVLSSQDLEPYLNNISETEELPMLSSCQEANAAGYDSQEIINEQLKYEESYEAEIPCPELSMESSPTGHNPSVANFPGPFVFLGEPDNTRKDKAWLYSDVLKKVFIDVEKILVMRFTMISFVPRLFVRALPVYSSSEFSHEPVRRCPTHSQNDDPEFKAHTEDGLCLCCQYNLAGHVLRSHSHMTFYQYNISSKRHSVVVPIPKPQTGDTHIAIPYSFGCKTSCASGMRRRPIDIVFTLENERQEVFGRQVVAVKICACPKRDIERLERDFFESGGRREHSDTLRPTKRPAKCLSSNSLHPLNSISKKIKLLPPMQSTDTDNSDCEADSMRNETKALLRQIKALYIQFNRYYRKWNKKKSSS